ncbi:hypothetical protein KGF54_004385 [Candida jiufengensis]|uniref:uncharacterized protein n=1 Tax=Candida jiufengensis TaxID=497108 RepID=UPI0022250FEF|nr:uncharacterized protein KGF54_004385 [Candida jiufengensis]KAI5951311.1 hypothetical protein KGF54_004385 [Candida jiufengensis]
MSTPTKSIQVTLKNPPTEFINPNFGESNSTFAIKEQEIPDLKDGEILIKTRLISNDPTQRGWIRRKGSKRYYVDPIEIGNPMESLAIGEVLESKSTTYKKGDLINGKFYWADFAIVNESQIFNKIDQSLGLPLEYYLSVFGMTSLTALFGLTEAGGLKKYLGDEKPKDLTVLVSAASGATGSVVVQIAKHLLGATKVLGISGSDEKCKWVESLGADKCFNYKDSNYQNQISEYLGDSLVNVYFDNVGGEISNFALTKMAKFGTVISCGSISTYNSSTPPSITNWGEITVNSLSVNGFIVFDYFAKFQEGVQILSNAVKEGKIKVTNAYHVDSLEGNDEIAKFEQIPKIWTQLFNDNKPNGKLITKVA